MNKDLKNTALYIINGIICNYKDFTGVYPSIEVVKGNFNYPKYVNIQDNEIQNIIDSVIRIDNI